MKFPVKCCEFTLTGNLQTMGKLISTLPKAGLLFSILFCSAGCVENQSTEADKTATLPKKGVTLRLKPLNEPIKFHLVRQERTLKHQVPQYKINLDLSFDLTVKRKSGNEYQIMPSNGDGLDLDKTQSKQLKKMAAILSKAPLNITLAENGAARYPKFIQANDSGWVGAIVLKALGMYELGFLDTILPDNPVEPGAKWNQHIDYAEEVKDTEKNLAEQFPNIKSSVTIDQTGPKAEYTLIKIESIEGRQIAEISFKSSGKVHFDHKHALMGNSSYQQIFTEHGLIKLDIETGWPVEFKMVRSVDTKSATVASVTESTTLVKRI